MLSFLLSVFVLLGCAVMDYLPLSFSISVASKRVVKVSNYELRNFFPAKKNICVYCQTRNRAIESTGISSVWTQEHKPSLLETESLVSNPNGKNLNLVCTEGIGIAKFLSGKAFFMTGATGFFGKVLIEKILRTAPDVNKIFVLIKAKNEKAAAERLKNEVINAEVFKHLKQTQGISYQAFMLSKLVPVVGNLCESNLGASEDAAEVMAKEVDIIISSAANTTFDERYDIALDINTSGPKRLMGFAKKCQKLKLFLQISTAYVNGQRQGIIMEKPFCLGQSIAGEEAVLNGNQQASPFPELCVEEEIKLAMESKQTAGHDDGNSVHQKMKQLGINRANKYGWQDTYVFTKAMGEMMIDSLKGDIPVVIIRPSVIESTYKEQFPGWIEGNRMMDPIILLYGKGQLTGFLLDPNGVLDVVPADMVVNATLAAMAKHGDGRAKTETTSSNIYHVASSVVNPLVYRNLLNFLYQHFNSSPYINSETGSPVPVSTIKFFDSMDDFSSHLWRHAIKKSRRGVLTNTDGKLSQNPETIIRKSVDQATYMGTIYKPDTFYGGRFDNSNTKRLMGCMSNEEMQQFGFDVENIGWEDYICNIHIPGLRKHVMKGRG